MIRQRDLLARNRHRIALLAVLGALSLAVATEHSGFGHTSPMQDGIGDVVSMCLAIVGAGAGGLMIVGGTLFAPARGIPSSPRKLGSGSGLPSLAPASPTPRVRASPPLLQVFRR